MAERIVDVELDPRDHVFTFDGCCIPGDVVSDASDWKEKGAPVCPVCKKGLKLINYKLVICRIHYQVKD